MKKLFYYFLLLINLSNLNANSKTLLELRNSTRRELNGSINFEISPRFRKSREVAKNFTIVSNDIEQLGFFNINNIKTINIEYDGQVRVFNIDYSRKNPQLIGLPLTFTFVEDGEFIHVEYKDDHGKTVIVNAENFKSSHIKRTKILLKNETGNEVDVLITFFPGNIVKRYNVKANDLIELESPVIKRSFILKTIMVLDSGKQIIFDINFSNKSAIDNLALLSLPMIFKIINKNGFYFIKYKNYSGEFITVPELVETEVQLINRTSNKLNISVVFASMAGEVKTMIRSLKIKPKEISKILMPKPCFGIKKLAIKMSEGTKVFNINFLKPNISELENKPSLNGLPMIFYITKDHDGFHIRYEDRQHNLIVVNQSGERRSKVQQKRQSRRFEGVVVGTSEEVWAQDSEDVSEKNSL